MWHEHPCPTCAQFNRELVQVMMEHLKAERDLYELALVLRDSVGAHQMEIRICQMMEKIAQLKAQVQ